MIIEINQNIVGVRFIEPRCNPIAIGVDMSRFDESGFILQGFTAPGFDESNPYGGNNIENISRWNYKQYRRDRPCVCPEPRKITRHGETANPQKRTNTRFVPTENAELLLVVFFSFSFLILVISLSDRFHFHLRTSNSLFVLPG